MEKPELFCFGLLEACDVKQLIALIAPRQVELPAASPRARTELAGLPAWYQLWQCDFDPLATNGEPTRDAPAPPAP